ncbi:hypothetical protein [Nocardia concava]|uniref:hypothetical protein n=1 Tax=Nocardia concava TaxID=257281 RepID=UPI00030AE2AB|nr:hypothetical protein [Nocardia concava]
MAGISFDEAVVALAEAPEGDSRERLWMMLGLPPDTEVPEFLPGASSAILYSCAVAWDGVSEGCGTDDVPAGDCRHLPIVIALLGSSLDEVRERARSVLLAFGLPVVGALRAIPPSNRLARREALAVLAELGWHLIKREDLVILERLIRMKQVLEPLEPLDFERLSGSWFAVPTSDQAAVLAAFDLYDPVPATLRMGFAPWLGVRPARLPYETAMSLHGLDFRDTPSRKAFIREHTGEAYPEVFVTPALNGWTLLCYADDIIGRSPESRVQRRLFTMPAQQRFELHRCLEELSLRFGSAHWYEQFVDDYAPGRWSQWCVARDGEVRMHCLSGGQVTVYRSRARPASEEADQVEAYLDMVREHPGRRDPSEVDEDDIEGGDPLQDQLFGARGASGRLSVDLTRLGPLTHVQGTGVLAVPAHLRHRMRRGVLPI